MPFQKACPHSITWISVNNIVQIAALLLKKYTISNVFADYFNFWNKVFFFCI